MFPDEILKEVLAFLSISMISSVQEKSKILKNIGISSSMSLIVFMRPSDFREWIMPMIPRIYLGICTGRVKLFVCSEISSTLSKYTLCSKEITLSEKAHF